MSFRTPIPDSPSTPRILHGFDAARDRPRPLLFLREALDYPALAVRHKALVWNFWRRDLHGRFRGSMLGIVWVLVHPICLFVTYYLVFGVMFGARSQPGQHEMWYSLYLFLGVIAWQAFADTTISATRVVVNNGNLIQKVAFPAQLLPLHIVAINSVVFLIGCGVYLLVAAVTGFPLPGWSLLLLPVVTVIQGVFALGVSLILAAGFVFVRDLGQLYPIVANLWCFATPVFWYAGMFPPDSPIHGFMPVLATNPLYQILEAQRIVMGTVAAGSDVLLAQIGWAALAAAVAFLAGFVVFRSLQYRFADEV